MGRWHGGIFHRPCRGAGLFFSRSGGWRHRLISIGPPGLTYAEIASNGERPGWVGSWDACAVGMDAWSGWMRSWGGCAVGIGTQLGWMRSWDGCVVRLDAQLGWMRGWDGCVVGLDVWLG